MIDFASLVRPGDLVTWSQGAGEPLTLIEALLAARSRIGRFGVFLGGSYAPVLTPEAAADLDVHGMGAVGANRALCRPALMQVHPINLSDLPRLFETGVIDPSVVMMQLGPGATEGAVNAYARYALGRARLRIAEINSAAPRTRGSTPVDLGAFDRVVEVDRPPVEVPSAPPDQTERAVARNVAGLIRDGDCLQIGIGTLPAAVLAELSGHRRLGYHAGVLGDAAQALIASGAMDGSEKPLDRGLAVAGALAGSAALYRWADLNPALRLEPVRHTHSIATLARLDRLVAVNSALEIDLTGQAGAEVAGTRYLGTVGGLADFARGALAAERGRSILCMSARTAAGAPRIVARIASGVVTLGRADADLVVTEHGVAALRGRSVAQRAAALAAIAHPEDRDALLAAARVLPGA